MAIVLFDNLTCKQLYPFSSTAAIGTLRAGIFTPQERLQRITKSAVYLLTQPHLAALYDTIPEGEHLWIDASLVYDKELFHRILILESGEALADEAGLIAGRLTIAPESFQPESVLSQFATIVQQPGVQRFRYAWQLYQNNDALLRADAALVQPTAVSKPLPAGSQYINESNIFIGEGASILFSTINASTGPVYIGRNAQVMEGCHIRGPVAICDNAVVKMGTRIYGATTIGPHAVVGGELKNVIMHSFSNKGHDGYLGDSVIGNWCNLGAGTSNSNVKNSGGIVTMWDDAQHQYIPVGHKCGLVMGDFTRSAINSAFNTGTVAGVCCNIFGEGLLPRFIPDFSWGVKNGTRYHFHKIVEDIANWKKMKGHELADAEITVLKYIFDAL